MVPDLPRGRSRDNRTLRGGSALSPKPHWLPLTPHSHSGAGPGLWSRGAGLPEQCPLWPTVFPREAPGSAANLRLGTTRPQKKVMETPRPFDCSPSGCPDQLFRATTVLRHNGEVKSWKANTAKTLVGWRDRTRSKSPLPSLCCGLCPWGWRFWAAAWACNLWLHATTCHHPKVLLNGFKHTQLRPWHGDKGHRPFWSGLYPWPPWARFSPVLPRTLPNSPGTSAAPDPTLLTALLAPELLCVAFTCGPADFDHRLLYAFLQAMYIHGYINNDSAVKYQTVTFSLGGKFPKGWIWFSLRAEGNCDLEPAQPWDDECIYINDQFALRHWIVFMDPLARPQRPGWMPQRRTWSHHVSAAVLRVY